MRSLPIYLLWVRKRHNLPVMNIVYPARPIIITLPFLSWSSAVRHWIAHLVASIYYAPSSNIRLNAKEDIGNPIVVCRVSCLIPKAQHGSIPSLPLGLDASISQSSDSTMESSQTAKSVIPLSRSVSYSTLATSTQCLSDTSQSVPTTCRKPASWKALTRWIPHP